MTNLVKDDSGRHAIQALTLKENGAHRINFNGSSVRLTAGIPATTKVISLYSTEDCFINIGDNTVTADNADHFFPAGVYYDITLPEASKRYIAAIQSTAAGALFISEKE